jgi:hypothetical protein
MTERWQQPELFRSRMIRHSLAPAEDTNADQNMMGAPKTCVAVTFLTGLETSIAKAAGWGADDAHQRKGEDVNDLMSSAELPPWPAKDTGLCRMEPSITTESAQDSSCFQSVSESRLGIISDSA